MVAGCSKENHVPPPEPPPTEWVRVAGGTLNDWGRGVVVDDSGRCYFTGFFRQTVDFGLDWGTTDVKTAVGNSDAFVTAVNSDGSYAWTRRIGGTGVPGNNSGESVAVDGLGNVYVTGICSGPVDFRQDWGTGTDTRHSGGGEDVFVTKILADGSYGWTRTIGGTLKDNGMALSLDGSGNVYVVGLFTGTVDFRADWGGTSDSKSSVGGTYDVFITRIDTDGSYVWTRQLGGPGGDIAFAVAVDNASNVFTAGYFFPSVDFRADWGGPQDMKTVGGAFITKLNSNGGYGWTRIVGGTSVNDRYDITTDTTGQLYCTGTFTGTVDFEADFGSGSDTKIGNTNDVFVLKIAADGSYGWTRTFGGTDWDFGHGITADSADNVYITGSFRATVDFRSDWGGGTDMKFSMGSADVFITKVLADGSYGWTKVFGGPDPEQGCDVHVDGSGFLYCTGFFSGTVDFWADLPGGARTEWRTSNGGPDMFLVKFDMSFP
jgi:hypothetical protein